MKTMVKMVILVATLLLLTGAAFAEGLCNCYEVTCKDLDHDLTITHFVELCFGPNNHGNFNGFCGYFGSLNLFFDHHPDQALASSGGAVLGYLKFHEWLDIFNGVMNCYGDRWKVRGLITDYDNCNQIPPP